MALFVLSTERFWRVSSRECHPRVELTFLQAALSPFVDPGKSAVAPFSFFPPTSFSSQVLRPSKTTKQDLRMSDASSDTNFSVFSWEGDMAVTDSSDPDAHTAEGYQYGRREIRGNQFQKWIDGDTEVECRVNPVTMTWDDMGADEHFKLKEELTLHNATMLGSMGIDPLKETGPGPNGEFAKVSVTLDTSNEPSNVGPSLEVSSNIIIDPSKRNRWVAYIGKGFVCMSELFRWYKVGRFSSEVVHSLYTHYYPIDSLSHCLVFAIVNLNTVNFIERLYAKKGYPSNCLDGADWQEVEKVRVWEYGTPEYKGLLGTRIGGVVAALVLGAFPRGTKRIANIKTCFSPSNFPHPEMFILSMKFEIATIGAETSVQQGSTPTDPSVCT